MIRTTRRAGLTGAASTLALPAIVTRARAADFAWRLGHTAPASFPLHIRLTEAAAEVEEKSGGRMSITVTGDSGLGSGVGQLAQVRNGTLEMTPTPGQILYTVQAMSALPMTGFAWTGREALWKAIDGDLGRVIRELQLQRANLITLNTVWDFGFRIVTTGEKPVRVAADLNGLRVRTPVEPEFVALFQALKANPIAMPLNETFRALTQGQVDGQEGLLALVLAAGFQAAQRYCAMTNHVWDGQWICVGMNAWRRLPDGLKTIVSDAFNAAGLRQRADHIAGDTAAREALTQSGMVFNTVDPASFRAVLRETGYYRELKRRFGDRYWDVLEQYSGRLT